MPGTDFYNLSAYFKIPFQLLRHVPGMTILPDNE